MTTNHTKRKRKQTVTFSAKLSCGQIIIIAIFSLYRVSVQGTETEPEYRRQRGC